MALNSNSVIKIVDLLCEGPIEGIEGGAKGVYLDESPLRSETGNFLTDKNNVSFELNVGGRGQSYLPQAKGKTSNVVNVSKEVGSGYTEDLNPGGTSVKKRDYGAGNRSCRSLTCRSMKLICCLPCHGCFLQHKRVLSKGSCLTLRSFLTYLFKQ